MAVAATIRAERAAAGMTREQVCTSAGIPTSTYRRMESGERVATVAQLSLVAPAFGLRTSQLVARAEMRIAQQHGPDTTPVHRGIPDSARVADVEVALAVMDDEAVVPTVDP